MRERERQARRAAERLFGFSFPSETEIILKLKSSGAKKMVSRRSPSSSPVLSTTLHAFTPPSFPEGRQLHYLLHRVPPKQVGTEASQTEPKPLLLYLHGAGGRADAGCCDPQFERVKEGGLTRILLAAAAGGGEAGGGGGQPGPGSRCHPLARAFDVLIPQCPRDLSGRKVEWKDLVVLEALRDLVVRHGAGAEVPPKIVVSGVSMGGLGSYMFAARYPEMCSALVPMCGGGNPVFALRLANAVPTWFVHAANDSCIGVEETDRLYEAIKAASASVSATTASRAASTESSTAAAEQVGCGGGVGRRREEKELKLGGEHKEPQEEETAPAAAGAAAAVAATARQAEGKAEWQTDMLRYTRYAETHDKSCTPAFVGHNVWDKAYNDGELQAWMIRHGGGRRAGGRKEEGN